MPPSPPSPDAGALEPGLRGANLVLMFVLEMAVYVGAGWLGARLSSTALLSVVTAAGLVLAFIVAWGLFGAPRAMRPLRGGARVALEVIWFGGGVAAFALAGQPGLGIALALLVAINLTLRWRWRQTPTLPGASRST